MKLSFFILFVFVCQLFALNTDAQNVTIELKSNKLSIEELFKEIEKQTDYLVIYSTSGVRSNFDLSLTKKKARVAELLNEALSGHGLKYEFVNNYIILSKVENQINQQTKKELRGFVYDQNGEPVIGANVVEKGTQNGTVTDIDGRFMLSVGNGCSLEISYIGYLTQLVTPKSNTVNVYLKEDSQSLEEVVVVGYGTQKKVNLMGAVSTIKESDIIQNVTSNMSNVLSGRLSGVFSRNTSGVPGSGSKILIRGTSTFNNSNPLTIVDGIERDYSNLDPNEIASISILKDAASAAVYGSRAANGVILVTTKRGMTGKPILNYSGSVGFQKPTGYPEMMTPYEFATMKNKAAINMGYDPSNPAHLGQFVSDDQLEQYRTGRKGVDWWEVCMKKVSPQTHHNLNINGGNDKIKYFFSAGYLYQSGMFENLSFNRYNFRSNVDAEILKGLTAQVSIDGRIEYNNSPADDADKIFIYLAADPLSFGFTPDHKPIDTGNGNPYEMIHSSGYDKKRKSFFQGTVSLKYDMPFLEGLSVKGVFAYDKNYLFKKRFTTPYKLYYVDDKNEVIDSKMYGPQTSLREEFDDQMSYSLNLSANYNQTFGKHTIEGLFLYEQYEGSGDSFWASRVNYLSNQIDQLFAGGDAGKDNNGKGFETGRQSLVGRVSYNWNNRYYLEGSIRYDGSVVFAEENRWGVFPSISASWRISEESFMKKYDFINNLKLRASYGVLGNDRVDPFQYMNYYTFANGAVFNGEISPGLNQAPLANPDITWEKAKTLDVGVEATLWNGLLSTEVDYFYKRTSDILAKKETSIPGTFGATLPHTNYAIVDNQGIDLMLRHDNKIDQVNYYVSSTFSFARNKVIRIDDPANQKEYLLRVGRPLGFISGYKSLGLFQSDEEAANYMTQFGNICKAGDIKYADINEDGKIDEDDQTQISRYNGNPELFFGLNLGAEWRGFEINAQLQGAANNIFIYDGRAKTLFWQGSNNAFSYLMDIWSPENRDAQYPPAWKDSNPNNSKYSDFWLRNAAYLKLRNLELAYNFPQSILQHTGINKLRVFVTATDLFTIKGDMEFDPEAAHMNYYPQQKSVNFGLIVSF